MMTNMRRSINRPGILALAAFLVAVNSASANNWPCLHGVDRSNKSIETGLLTQWLEDGPKLLWTASGLGEGYSSVSIADGKIFTAGMSNNKGFVYAFDLNGTLLWKTENGAAWEAAREHARAYTGARGTPTVDGAVVYHLGEAGRLAAFDTKSGKQLWAIDIHAQFEAAMPMYGYAESVLIDGDKLYCNPAGKKGFMVCLKKKDGSLVWANTEISGGGAYNSSVPVTFGGYRQILGMSSSCFYGVDALTGKLLWDVPLHNSRNNNCTDPIFYAGHVYASSGYGTGSHLVKLDLSGKKITPTSIWKSELLDNHHGGVIHHDGFLYGSGHNARELFCLEFMSGKETWKAPGKGSLTWAENMLYVLEERGTMRLVHASPESFKEMSSFEVPSGGKGLYWAHPVVCGARLYVRHADNLYAYNIRTTTKK